MTSFLDALKIEILESNYYATPAPLFNDAKVMNFVIS
jgi:hypothetical protein